MAEMACGIDSNVSVKLGNDVIQHWTMENRQQQQPHQPQDEKSVNVDEAAFESGKRETAAAKEAMSQLSIISTQSTKKYTFSSRECSNVCWALAKLRMAPPKSAIPIGRVVVVEEEDVISSSSDEASSSEVINGSNRQFTSMDEMSLDVLSSSLNVRMKLFEEARNRKQQGSSTSTTTKNSESSGGGGGWIPELSRLSGKVLDLIAVQIINEYGSRSTDSSNKTLSTTKTHPNGGGFNPQEMASMLWAFAKAKRGDSELFSVIANELMRQTEFELGREGGGQGPKPQGEECYKYMILFLLT